MQLLPDQDGPDLAMQLFGALAEGRIPNFCVDFFLTDIGCFAPYRLSPARALGCGFAVTRR